MSDVTARCKQKRAAHDSGWRRPSSIRHVVIHSTEGGTAASVAAMFASESARASTHFAIDDLGCYRMLPDLVIPWGAPGVNTSGLHIEHCGFARWSRAEWLEHDRTLRRSAYKAARWCWLYRIPRRWLTPEEVAGGVRGFLCHSDATKAFSTPGGHTDPGPGFPRDLYMKWVKAYYSTLRREDL